MLLFIPRSLCALKRVAAKSEHARFGATQAPVTPQDRIVTRRIEQCYNEVLRIRCENQRRMRCANQAESRHGLFTR
jgi:hypothetical protein